MRRVSYCLAGEHASAEPIAGRGLPGETALSTVLRALLIERAERGCARHRLRERDANACWRCHNVDAHLRPFIKTIDFNVCRGLRSFVMFVPCSPRAPPSPSGSCRAGGGAHRSFTNELSDMQPATRRVFVSGHSRIFGDAAGWRSAPPQGRRR